MRRIVVVALAATLVLLGSAPAPAAEFSKTERKYLKAYERVADKHGERAPGRNIVKWGVRYRWASKDGERKVWKAREARFEDVKHSLFRLRALLRPAPPNLVLQVGAPHPPPGYVATGSLAPSATLQSIAACESGGDPTAVSPDGRYRGKYQFTYSTWGAMGGSGDPAAAPESEQDMRAARLLAEQGTGPWPTCGR